MKLAECIAQGATCN